MNQDTTSGQATGAIFRLRLLYFAAISIPVLLGAAIAWHHTGQFDVGLFTLSLAGVLMLLGGTTMTNDAFDLRYHEGEQPLLPVQVLQGALAFFVVGIMLGIYIALLTGPLVVVLGLLGVSSALLYSVPPVRLAGTGAGELLAGLNLSVVTTVGSYYVQTGQVSAEVVTVTVPPALLLAGVLAINGFRPSKLIEQRPLWNRLGPRSAFHIYLACVVCAFGWLAGGVFLRLVPLRGLVSCGALPLAVVALRAAHTSNLRQATRYGAYAYLTMMGLLVFAYAA